MAERIDKCPICGGELQGTKDQYLSDVVLNEDGDLVDYSESKVRDGDVRIYCENDHTFEEMMEALEPPTFQPERSVLVAADSWKKLRRVDVYRLFESHDDSQWEAIFQCLKGHRPDLVGEAREAMADLEADMHSTWMAE